MNRSPSLRSLALLLVAAVAVPLALAAAAGDEAAPGPAPERAQEVLFHISALRSTEGRVVCGLFDEAGWLRSRVRAAIVEIEATTVTCAFAAVEPGWYGLSAYHDEDGDGELDTGRFGIPSEGTAASNDARSLLGPPKYREARFEYRGGTVELTAPMRYR